MNPTCLLSFLLMTTMLVLSAGCREEAAPTPKVVQKPKPTFKSSYKPPYDEDGIPHEAKEEVFGDPIPQWTYTVGVDPLGAASFSSQYKYSDLVKFYKTKLGDDFESTKTPNATKFVSKNNSENSVFVFKSKRPGQRARIIHFNYRGEIMDVPNFEDPKPERRSIERKPWRSRSSSKRSTASTPSLYDTKRVERPDGSSALVMTRNNNTVGGRGKSASRTAKKSRWIAEEGTAFPSNTARIVVDRKKVQF